MNKIEHNHVNGLIIKASKLLLDEGQLKSPRNHETLELMNVWFELTNPKKSICTLPQRKLSRKYLNAELDWYRSGELHIDGIKDYSSMWETIADDYGYVNSNYGYWAKHYSCNDYITQFAWCADKLYQDPDTRQAVINYNNPMHKYHDVKDFPCTISQQFYIRNNQLDCVVIMRSNDLIYGFCYDVPWFTLIQKELAQLLNIKLGSYFHYATSLHVYKKHFKMIGEMADL